MKVITLILISLALSFNLGCTNLKGGKSLGMGDMIPVAAGAVAGHYLGDALDGSDAGRLGGAILGVIAAQQMAEYIARNNQQQILEAYEQGKREARVEAASEFWSERTYADGSHPSLSGGDPNQTRLRQIQHDHGYVEGVLYGSSYISDDQVQKR